MGLSWDASCNAVARSYPQSSPLRVGGGIFVGARDFLWIFYELILLGPTERGYDVLEIVWFFLYGLWETILGLADDAPVPVARGVVGELVRIPADRNP